MSIKTYEIHNSYLQDAPDSTGITRMVSEADYLSQLQQTDALQTSLNNIINAFGISGEGAHSKLVIEYVHGLVVENAAMRKAIDETIGWQDSVDPGNAESVRLLVALQTPSTDAFTAELRAQGVDELAEAWEAIKPEEGVSMSESTALKYKQRAQDAREYAANLRAGSKG